MAGNIRRNRNNELLAELAALQRALALQAISGSGASGPPGPQGDPGLSGEDMFQAGPPGPRPEVSAVTRVGENTTEATTTAAGKSTLMSLVSEVPPAGSLITAVVETRKSTGSAHTAQIGLEGVGGVVVFNEAAFTTATNQAESGLSVYQFMAGQTNYTDLGFVIYGTTELGKTLAVGTNNFSSANLGTYAVVGRSNGGINTLGVDEFRVFIYIAA